MDKTEEKIDRHQAKEFRRQAKELRLQILEENQYKELDAAGLARQCCGDALRDFDAQSHDAWVLQCPKGTDPRQLAGRRIKLPGRKCVGDLQVRAVNYSAPPREAVGYVSSKGKFALQKLPLAGYIVVSKRLNAKQPAAEGEEQVFPAARAPPKFLFSVRHPLFGRDYKQRIQVSEKISESISQADKQNQEATARLWHTSNYYKIRSKLLSTTQTLEQKEHDVRQSVLTGRKPKFMDAKKTFSDGTVLKEQILESADEAAPFKKSKKKKLNGSVVANGHGLVEGVQEEAIAPKKQKKRKSNGQILVNGSANTLDNVEIMEKQVEGEIASKKHKKFRSNGQTILAAAADNADEIIVIEDEPASAKKQKKPKHRGEVSIVIDDDMEVKNKMNDAEAPPRKRKKLKASE